VPNNKIAAAGRATLPNRIAATDWSTVSWNTVSWNSTWELLAQLECDLGQGYHISRPRPAADLTRWLAEAVPADRLRLAAYRMRTADLTAAAPRGRRGPSSERTTLAATRVRAPSG
jgi:hypothetical protein